MTGLVDPGRGRRRRRLGADDGSLPPLPDLLVLLGRSVLLPLVVWLVVLAGSGYLLANQLKSAVSGEDAVNRWLAASRTAAWNTVTHALSHVGNTETIIVTMLAAAFVIWRVSGRLREPAALIVGVGGQAGVFLLTTLLIDRPRPQVPKLDQSPPTSSFPSGHTGASTALYLGLVVICVTRLERTWLKVLAAVGFGVVPLAVAAARLYRGMHHPTDVVFGLLNGTVCALIAYRAFRDRGD